MQSRDEADGIEARCEYCGQAAYDTTQHRVAGMRGIRQYDRAIQDSTRKATKEWTRVERNIEKTTVLNDNEDFNITFYSCPFFRRFPCTVIGLVLLCHIVLCLSSPRLCAVSYHKLPDTKKRK